MAHSVSPDNACTSIFELDVSEEDVNMWPEDNSELRESCGDFSTRLGFDSDCSQQFDGLVINRESRTYSFNEDDNDPLSTDAELLQSDSLSLSSNNKLRLSKSSSSITSASVGSSRSVIRCGICNKTFNNSSALAKHKLIHSDERKYTCTQCSKSFKRQDHLNGHMMTHSTKKPYECKFLGCDKSYCDARSLRRHIDNQHPQLHDTCSSATGSLTPRSAAGDNAGYTSQGLVFNFDFAGGSPAPLGTGIAYPPLSGSDASLTTDPTSPPSSVSPGGPSNQVLPGVWTGDGNPFDEPKPIQCSVCDKRFRNLPALNGHMRLHGGYSRQTISDSDKTQAMETQSEDSHSSSLILNSHSEPISVIEKNTKNTVEQENHWLDCKPVVSSEGIPVDIQAALIDHCQILNPNMPTLFISHPTSKCDASNAVYVGSSTSNDNTVAAEVNLQTALAEQYTLSIDRATSGHPSSLPVLMGPENIQVVLGGSSSTPLSSEIDSSFIACPIITSNDSLAGLGLHMEKLPTSTVVLFSQTQLVREATAFPSPRTPSLSSIILGGASLQEPRVSPVNNPTSGTPNVRRGMLQSPIPVGQAVFAFPTPLTPGQSQLRTPTSGANFFKFTPVNTSHLTGILSVEEAPLQPRTPIYTVAFSQPQVGSQLFSPRTPYTPATPSIFQFPPTSSAVRDSTVNCSSPYMVQKHHVSYHPYSQSIPGELHSPHLQRLQQQAAIRKAEERKKFEQDVAEAHLEIEHHLKQLKQEDLVRKQIIQQSSVLLSSESQAVVPVDSISSNAIHLNASVNETESTVASIDLVQQVDDVLQVLAEQADDMDTLQGDGCGTSNLEKEISQTALCSLQSVPDDSWMVGFRDSIDSLTKPKRKQKPEPLVIPDSMSNFRQLTSQVLQHAVPIKRNLIGGSQATPYTPPPMRSPLWGGSGFSRSVLKSGVPLSAPPCRSTISVFSAFNIEDESECETKDSRVQPRVNIGPEFQADLPTVCAPESTENINGTGETLLWNPKIVEGLTDEELLNYQNFASCAALPGSGANREYALHLLQMCNGRIKAAQLKLMQGGQRSGQERYHEEWSPDEIDIYSQALIETNKDFNIVAKKVGSKSVKQCVQFYYLWKKVCSEEYEKLCRLNRHWRDQQPGLCESMQTDELAGETCRPSLITGPS